MPGISRVGFRLVALMGVLAVIGLFIQVANAIQAPRLPSYTPPMAITVWKRSDIALPRLDALRGSPAEATYIYSHGIQAPAHVSIARADSLDAYRAPYIYLLDEDGRLYNGNQESLSPRAYEKLPVRTMYLGESRDGLTAILHWTQAPGEDPILDPTDSPARMLGAMLTKKPLYICDVWLPIRSDANFSQTLGVLTFLADSIDKDIKALPKN